MLWLMLVPFVLVLDLGWYTVFVAFFIGYSLMGIEAIIMEISDPFGKDFTDIPLDDMMEVSGSHTLAHTLTCTDTHT